MLNLDNLGKKIVADARRTSHKDTGKLAQSITYSVNGDTLTLSQLEYGMYQEPNALEVSIEKVLNQEVGNIAEQITEDLLKNFK